MQLWIGRSQLLRGAMASVDWYTECYALLLPLTSTTRTTVQNAILNWKEPIIERSYGECGLVHWMLCFITTANWYHKNHSSECNSELEGANYWGELWRVWTGTLRRSRKLHCWKINRLECLDNAACAEIVWRGQMLLEEQGHKDHQSQNRRFNLNTTTVRRGVTCPEARA
jgi:hypothetical protein